MSDTNVWVGSGRLTRDPEVRYTPGGRATCEIAVAVHHPPRAKREGDGGEKPEDEVSFVPVRLWEKTAKYAGEYLKKGGRIIVTGYWKQERWETEQGEKRSRFVVVAQKVQNVGEPRSATQEPDEPLYVETEVGM